MAWPDNPWEVLADDFPRHDSLQVQLHFLLHYAVLAPSSHNTQPWLFRIGRDHADILADRTRALPVVDPEDRALLISCGAALENLLLSLARFGYDAAVQRFPDRHDPDCLARVYPWPSASKPDATERVLFDAIPIRRTTRRAFESRPLPRDLLDACHDAAAVRGVLLHAVTDETRRHEIAMLVAEGDQVQFADPHFRRELASWIHSRHLATHDGISAAGFGMPDLLSPVGAMIIRTFDLGNGVAAQDQKIAEGSPALLVLSTEEDEPAAWLRTGQALSRVLLTIAAGGATAAYLNQAIEVARLRPRLAELAGTARFPQILLRAGYGPATDPAVRRPLCAVVL